MPAWRAVYLLRLGFTGELSYELHVPASYGLYVWETLIKCGRDLGIEPFGIEAQRIMRLEKGHVIVGQDTDGLTQAFSLGLGKFIKLAKPDFVGKPELKWQSERSDYSRLVGLWPADPTLVPPEASLIVNRDRILGRITSSRMSLTLQRSICMALVSEDLSHPGISLSPSGLPDGRLCVGGRLPNDASTSIRKGQDCVAETVPIARSPITPALPVTLVAGWEMSAKRSAATLRLTDCTPCGKVLVRAGLGSAIARVLGVSRGRVSRDTSGRLVAGIGHEEWLIIGSPDLPLPSRVTERSDGGPEPVTIVDVTHARALMRIVGADSAKVMSKLCGIDFGDKATPDNTALRTSMAGLVVEVIRSDLANRPGRAGSDTAYCCYLVLCERSAGQYLFNTLLDAGEEFGVDIEGFGISGL